MVLPPHLCPRLSGNSDLVLRLAEGATTGQQQKDSQDVPGLRRRTLWVDAGREETLTPKEMGTYSVRLELFQP